MAQKMLCVCDRCLSNGDIESAFKDRRGRGLFWGSENEAIKTGGWRKLLNGAVVCRLCQIEEEQKEKEECCHF